MKKYKNSGLDAENPAASLDGKNIKTEIIDFHRRSIIFAFGALALSMMMPSSAHSDNSDNVKEDELPDLVSIPYRERSYLGKMARLEKGRITDNWMSEIRKNLTPQTSEAERRINVLKAIHKTYIEKGFRYSQGPVDVHAGIEPMISAIQFPKRILMTRAGRCVDSALLVGATLREFKIPFLLVLATTHIVAAAIIDEEKKGPITTLNLMPVDLAAIKTKKDDFYNNVRNGIDFINEGKIKFDFEVFDGDGNILDLNDKAKAMYPAPDPLSPMPKIQFRF